MQQIRPVSSDDRVHLSLGGFTLRVITSRGRLMRSVTDVLTPACAMTQASGGPDWTLRVEEAQEPDDSGISFSERLVLSLPHSGRPLAVADVQPGAMRLLARYHEGGPVAVIETDAACRSTLVVVPEGDDLSLRWASWLARVFFASRLLGAGWRMLHASAVASQGRAVIFLAGPRGGKSVLAHRAVSEFGAEFLADDLVMVSPDHLVVGWPTRIALPAEMVPAGMEAGRRIASVVDGLTRNRVVFTPPEHRTHLAVTYSGPVPAHAIVSVCPGPGVDGVSRSALTLAELHAALRVAADIPAQVMHVSDPLGIMGGPRLTKQISDGGTAWLPEHVIRTRLRIGDMAGLSSAPIWAALRDVVAEDAS